MQRKDGYWAWGWAAVWQRPALVKAVAVTQAVPAFGPSAATVPGSERSKDATMGRLGFREPPGERRACANLLWRPSRPC